ncbi:unnamed protein product, partial [Closterium sp. Yama58-4]
VITNITRAGCKTLDAAFVLRHEDVPRVRAITHALTRTCSSTPAWTAARARHGVPQAAHWLGAADWRHRFHQRHEQEQVPTSAAGDTGEERGDHSGGGRPAGGERALCALRPFQWQRCLLLCR